MPENRFGPVSDRATPQSKFRMLTLAVVKPFYRREDVKLKNFELRRRLITVGSNTCPHGPNPLLIQCSVVQKVLTTYSDNEERYL